MEGTVHWMVALMSRISLANTVAGLSGFLGATRGGLIRSMSDG